MMLHRYRASLLVLVTLAGALFAIGAVRAASLAQPGPVAPTPPAAPTPGANAEPDAPSQLPFDPNSLRQRDQFSADAPDISFIDSPSATCYLPRGGTDACYITWQYLYVSASTSQYIISMTLSIDSQRRAYVSGFFQNSIYVPGDMFKPGFRVACGTPGSGGNPYQGRQYPYTIRARETGGLKTANYGTVTCPADQVPLESLELTGPVAGNIGVDYTFTASAFPITSTLPVTYVWQVTGYPAITHTNGISDTGVFSWSTLGPKTVKVTASNPVSTISQTHTITMYAITPISALAINGPTSGLTGVNYTFTASVDPISATLPVTYVWDVTGFPSITLVNGLSASQTLSWSTSGLKVIQVTASNPVSSLAQSAFVAIGVDQKLYQLYLPMMRR